MFIFQHNSNQSFIKGPLLKWTLKYCFLLILSLSFFAQHLFAFSLYRNSQSEPQESYVEISQQQQQSIHFAESLPVFAELAAVEMEMEEDDQVSNSDQSESSFFSHWNTADYFIYNLLVRIRFLQLRSSVDKQPIAPLFVLNHSWKYSIA
jgi:hypothetical protein